MTTGFSESGQTEANWFFAKKAGEGEIVISFQWGLCLREENVQACTSPFLLPAAKAIRKKVLKVKILRLASFKGSKGALVKDIRTKIGPKRENPYLEWVCPCKSLQGAYLSANSWLLPGQKVPNGQLLQFCSQQLWQASNFWQWTKGSKFCYVWDRRLCADHRVLLAPEFKNGPPWLLESSRWGSLRCLNSICHLLREWFKWFWVVSRCQTCIFRYMRFWWNFWLNGCFSRWGQWGSCNGAWLTDSLETKAFWATLVLLLSFCTCRCTFSVWPLVWELQDKRHSRPDPPRRCSKHLCSQHLNLGLVRHRLVVCDSIWWQTLVCAKLCKLGWIFEDEVTILFELFCPSWRDCRLWHWGNPECVWLLWVCFEDCSRPRCAKPGDTCPMSVFPLVCSDNWLQWRCLLLWEHFCLEFCLKAF